MVTIRAAAVDSEGYAIFAGANWAVLKYSSEGSQQTSTNLGGGSANAVTTQGTDLIVGGTVSSSNNIRRYEKSGSGFNTTPVFSRNYLNAPILSIAIDFDENIYVGAEKETGKNTLAKFNSEGTSQWSVDTGYSTFALALDEVNGHLYVSALGDVRKYNSSTGVEITTGGWPYSIGASVYALALVVPPPVPAPGLPLPLGIGLPLGTFGHTAGGLLAPLYLALPTATEPALPPIAPARTLYELWIGAGSEAIRLPMEEFQCRRRRNDSTWLAVRLPGIERAAGLRALVGRTVRLYAGDGATMGEFLRATLTDVADEQSAWSATTTLTCRAEAPADPLQTRTLSGVENIVIENGRRFVRCTQVDFRLRPGDYAVADGETFLVYGVNYRVGATVALMDVRETP